MARRAASSPQDFVGFSPASLAFLREVRQHNSKVWLAEHRADYEEHLLRPLRSLVGELAGFMLSVDPDFEIRPAVGKTISRIYRDTRFSRDKSPLRDHMWIVFHRPGLAPGEEHGFFFEIYLDHYRYGMGFYSASRQAMDRVRAKIDADPRDFLEVVSPITADGTFALRAESYKRSLAPHLPPGLRPWYDGKSFYLECSRPNDALLFSPRLATEILQGFELLAPLYRFVVSAIR